jgi:Sugar (and other) transporter
MLMQSLVSRGTSTIAGKWSYETMFVVQYIFPFVLFCGYPFFPESPYYLLKKGKIDQARKSLNRIHGSGDQDFINIELERIQNNVRTSEELELTRMAAKGVPYLQLFRGINLVITSLECSNL